MTSTSFFLELHGQWLWRLFAELSVHGSQCGFFSLRPEPTNRAAGREIAVISLLTDLNYTSVLHQQWHSLRLPTMRALRSGGSGYGERRGDYAVARTRRTESTNPYRTSLACIFAQEMLVNIQLGSGTELGKGVSRGNEEVTLNWLYCNLCVMC